jgi:hypothetical protein
VSIFDKLNPIAAISKLVDSVSNLIDGASTTEEEKLQAKRELFEAQTAFQVAWMDFQVKMAEQQAKVITVEAQGGWMQRNWRPALMFVFMAILFNNWILLPYIPGVQALEFPTEFWALLTVGVGGYIGAREYGKKQQTDLIKSLNNLHEGEVKQ